MKSPVHLKFGIENYQVAAVPQGTVETARPGMGHYHVAVDSDCLSGRHGDSEGGALGPFRHGEFRN